MSFSLPRIWPCYSRQCIFHYPNPLCLLNIVKELREYSSRTEEMIALKLLRLLHPPLYWCWKKKKKSMGFDFSFIHINFAVKKKLFQIKLIEFIWSLCFQVTIPEVQTLYFVLFVFVDWISKNFGGIENLCVEILSTRICLCLISSHAFFYSGMFCLCLAWLSLDNLAFFHRHVIKELVNFWL